jgi:membrane associated rhomboid family serine protease
LIGINLVLFLLFNVLDHRSEQLIAQRGVSALAFYQRYPYLELKPPLDAFLDLHQLSGASPAATADFARAGVAPTGAETSLRRTQQTELDSRVERFAQATDRISSGSFGFVPRDNKWPRLITYQFMHRGWFHLLGNLCFLGLVGFAIERTWARRQFLILYVSAGIVAAIVHKLAAPDSSIPLLGASGAIAGIMGAFFLQRARTNIRRLPMFLLGPNIWNLLVLLILGLWFSAELIGALISVRTAAGAAHFAHLGGFACGLAIAIARRKPRIESQIDARLEGLNGAAQDALVLPAAIVISE